MSGGKSLTIGQISHPLSVVPEAPDTTLVRLSSASRDLVPVAHVSHRVTVKHRPADLDKAGQRARENRELVEKEKEARRAVLLEEAPPLNGSGGGKKRSASNTKPRAVLANTAAGSSTPHPLSAPPSRTGSPAIGSPASTTISSAPRHPSRLVAVPPSRPPVGPSGTFRIGKGTVPASLSRSTSASSSSSTSSSSGVSNLPLAAITAPPTAAAATVPSHAEPKLPAAADSPPARSAASTASGSSASSAATGATAASISGSTTTTTSPESLPVKMDVDEPVLEATASASGPSAVATKEETAASSATLPPPPPSSESITTTTTRTSAPIRPGGGGLMKGKETLKKERRREERKRDRPPPAPPAVTLTNTVTATTATEGEEDQDAEGEVDDEVVNPPAPAPIAPPSSTRDDRATKPPDRKKRRLSEPGDSHTSPPSSKRASKLVVDEPVKRAANAGATITGGKGDDKISKRSSGGPNTFVTSRRYSGDNVKETLGTDSSTRGPKPKKRKKEVVQRWYSSSSEDEEEAGGGGTRTEKANGKTRTIAPGAPPSAPAASEAPAPAPPAAAAATTTSTHRIAYLEAYADYANLWARLASERALLENGQTAGTLLKETGGIEQVKRMVHELAEKRRSLEELQSRSSVTSGAVKA